jgi:ribosomal protein L37AE/L43A
MFCGDIHETAWSAEQAGASRDALAGRPRLPIAARTLYASVWHCEPCGETVRVYSRLQSAVSGEVPADCPACETPMTPLVRRRSGVWDLPSTPARAAEALTTRTSVWSA